MLTHESYKIGYSLRVEVENEEVSIRTKLIWSLNAQEATALPEESCKCMSSTELISFNGEEGFQSLGEWRPYMPFSHRYVLSLLWWCAWFLSYDAAGSVDQGVGSFVGGILLFPRDVSVSGCLPVFCSNLGIFLLFHSAWRAFAGLMILIYWTASW